MDISMVQTLLSSVGFPIICCYFMYQYIGKKDDQLNQIMENHKKEMEKFSEALDRNTSVIEKMLDKMGGGKD